MPAIRNDTTLLRLLKDVNDIRANLRRIVSNLPLYDIDNENTPATLSASQNNYVPGNYDVLRISSSTYVSITGIANGKKGRSLKLINVGSFPIMFINESSQSLSANRFTLPEVVMTLHAGGTLEFYYDATTQRWTQLIDVSSELSAPFTWASNTNINGTFNDIAWANSLGLFVAVGSNAVKTSPDGTNWTSQTPGSAINWTGVCWSQDLGLLVAVGAGFSMTSTDGVNWTSYAAASANSWTSVCWSPDLSLFVAVSLNGTANRVMTSPDGQVWTSQSTAGLDVAWQFVEWSDSLGLLVAGAIVTPYIMTSSNGVNWSSSSGSGGYSGASSDALGLFAAVQPTPVTVSQDGSTWDTADLPSSGWDATGGGSAGAAWSEERGYFVAVRYNQAIWSPSGTAWYSFSSVPTGQWDSVAYSPELDLFCAISIFSGLAMTG